MSLAGRCVLELIGTYFLTLVIATAAVGGMAGSLAPLAIGGILTAMIYMAGPHCGAHFNPAVTVGIWIRGASPAREVVPYIVAQVLGALFAVLTQLILLEGAPLINQAMAMAALGQEGGEIADWLQVGTAEFIFTFALVFVILHVATAPEQAGNQYFGAAVGLTVMAGAFAVGPVSSAVFNPAVLVGIWSLGAVSALTGFVILLATFAGGLLAALTFRAIHNVQDKAD